MPTWLPSVRSLVLSSMFIKQSYAASTWKRFRPTGRRAALHTTLRVVSLPLEQLLRVIPRDGDVLEVGCGHGVVSLALVDHGQLGTVTGVDVDEQKIATANLASERKTPAGGSHFQVVDASWSGLSGSYDIVIVVDVLYLLGESQATAAIDRLSNLVAPGGTLVLKGMSRSPRWKSLIDRLQEALSVRVLRITTGAQVAPFPVEMIANRLDAFGWNTTIHRLDRGYPHPHAAVVATLLSGPVPPNRSGPST